MNLMKRLLLLLLLIILLPCVGCSHEESIVDATKYGVLPTNSGLQNSENLQKLIDELSVSGGVIYIPAGEYEFAEIGTQTIGAHCIKMRSNVLHPRSRKHWRTDGSDACWPHPVRYGYVLF